MEVKVLSSTVKDCQIQIYQTTDHPRPTDHYGIHAQIKFN
jgi:hypothetical protein